MPDTKLYNCQTDAAEPDWSQWISLEIAGCRDANEGRGPQGETFTLGNQPLAQSEFFTIYGRTPRQQGISLADAITDCTTLDEVRAVAAQLSKISGLPLTVAPSLGVLL